MLQLEHRLRAKLRDAARAVGVAGAILPGIVPSEDDSSAARREHRASVILASWRGGVTVIRDGREQKHAAQENFPLAVLGEARHASREPSSGLPAAVWEGALAAQAEPVAPEVPPEMIALMEQRQISRDQRDWAAADHLREQIAAGGWTVVDTSDGPHLEPAVGARL